MKTKLLFWGAALFLTLGCHAGEGHLFFFFGSLWLVLAIGLFCMKRELTATSQPPAADGVEAARTGGQTR